MPEYGEQGPLDTGEMFEKQEQHPQGREAPLRIEESQCAGTTARFDVPDVFSDGSPH